MSLSSKKQKIFDKVALLRTTSEINSSENKFASISAKAESLASTTKDPFGLLVELLKVVVGAKAVNDAIFGLLKGVKKFESDFKTTLKHEISDNLGGDKNKGKPNTDIQEKGFTIGILKLDPNRRLFSKDQSLQSSHQKKLAEAIRNAGRTIQVNKILSVQYNNLTGDMNFKFVFTNSTFTDFLYGLVDEVIFMETEHLMDGIMDDLFNHSDKSAEEILYDEKVNMILSKFITEEDSDDSYFKFSGDEVVFMEEKVTTNKENYYGVPDVDGTLTKDDYLAVKSRNKKYNSTFFTDLVNTLTGRVNAKNKEGAKQNFYSRFLSALKNNILKNFLFSPEIVLIYNILGNSSDDGLTFVKNNKNFISCILKSIVNKILETLYNILKQEILIIVASVSQKYIEESVKKHKNILLGATKSKIL